MTLRRRLFDRLLDEYGDRAYGFAFRLTGNEEDARDLVQDAFLRAYERLGDYDPERPFFTWFCTLLQHIYIDGVRKVSQRPGISMDAADEEHSALSELLPEAVPSAFDGLAAEETDAAVQAAIGRLEPEMRTVVVLSDIEGFSYEEIAAVIRRPIGTVRSRLARARLRLKRILSPYLAGEVLTNGR